LLPQAFQPLSIALGVAVLEKARVTVVGGADAAGMLDRAPVLLRAGRDLARIAGQTQRNRSRRMKGTNPE
jgi:hypothetical protein